MKGSWFIDAKDGVAAGLTGESRGEDGFSESWRRELPGVDSGGDGSEGRRDN